MTATHIEGDRMEHERFCLIADKIEADPSLLCIPLENITRWIERGTHSKNMLDIWITKIKAAQSSKAGMAALLTTLRDDSEDIRFLKGFSPFPGVLTKKERRALPWTSRH